MSLSSKKIYSNLCAWVFCLYVCLCTMYMLLYLSVEVRKGHQESLELKLQTDGCELPSMWVLGCKPRSSERAISALNC